MDAKLAEEIQNINNSTRDAQVDAVKDRAINEINAINAQAHKRQDAINALTAQAESKKLILEIIRMLQLKRKTLRFNLLTLLLLKLEIILMELKQMQQLMRN